MNDDQPRSHPSSRASWFIYTVGIILCHVSLYLVAFILTILTVGSGFPTWYRLFTWIPVGINLLATGYSCRTGFLAAKRGKANHQSGLLLFQSIASLLGSIVATVLWLIVFAPRI